MEIQLEEPLQVISPTIIDTTVEHQTPKKFTLYDLNKDEIFCVLQFLDFRGVLAMSATCKKLYIISSK
jgi:hypothetical protein